MADTKISNLAAVTDVQDTDEFVLARAGVSNKIDGVDLRSELAGGGLYDAYAYLRDEKSNGSNGGSSTTTTWTTRVLNTEKADAAGIVSLSSNQFTLQAGTYLIHARCPFVGNSGVLSNQRVLLQNITDAVTVDIGSNQFGFNNSGHAFLTVRVTIAGAKAFEIQHWTDDGRGTIGLGYPTSAGLVEVYTEVEIWREA